MHAQKIFVNMVRGMKYNVGEKIKIGCVFSLQYPLSSPVLFSYYITKVKAKEKMTNTREEWKLFKQLSQNYHVTS